jgi:hypothetical protein
MWDLPPGYQAPPKLVTRPEIYCASCGVGLMKGPRFCPHCGADLPPFEDLQTTRGSVAMKGCLQALSIILFLFIGIPAAALGGCFMMMGGISDVTVFLFSLIALAIACGLAWLMVWSFRSQ